MIEIKNIQEKKNNNIQEIDIYTGKLKNIHYIYIYIYICVCIHI